jgi:hypothetical protein
METGRITVSRPYDKLYSSNINNNTDIFEKNKIRFKFLYNKMEISFEEEIQGSNGRFRTETWSYPTESIDFAFEMCQRNPQESQF